MTAKLREGTYRGVLYLDEGMKIELPFNFDISYKGKRPLIVIRNGDEKIIADEINVKGDSVLFKMPVFDTEFRMLQTREGFEGVWINHYRTAENRLRFAARYNEPRRFVFEPARGEPVFEGRWEVTFSPGSKDSTKAVGIFHHVEQSELVTGTFLTETGDYRYLEGAANGNTLSLSAFDGSHAFLFTARYENGKITDGKFYSGMHWTENWEAVKNDEFKLRAADEITVVTDASKPLAFSYPDTEGKTVSLTDKRYLNKPVIVQLMGSWCPNCMDESRYLSALYRIYQPQGLEIVALAFEKTTDEMLARQLVSRLRSRLSIEYPILLTLRTGKQSASQLFSNLNSVTAFPTTLFLDRDHKIVKVHSGFSGPATGKDYENFKEETEKLVKNLLAK